MEPEIGRILKQAREERGISLYQAEQATKIRARYLQELERENFDVLPPVYVQGSLRTYADYLGLDAESLVRELKHRQTPRDEPQGPVHGGSPGGGSAGSSVIGATAAEDHRTTGEEGLFVVPALRPVGSNGLYLASAALLVIFLAVVAFVSTLAVNGQPPVSHLRDPMASQEDQLAIQPRSASDGRNAGRESESRTPEQEANSPGGNAEEGSGQRERGGDGSQDSAAASTAQPSPATARSTATPESSAPSTAPPEATRPEPAPTGAEDAAPEPAARRSDGASPGRRVVTIRRPSSGGPVAVGGSPLPGRRMIVVRPRPLAR